MHFTNDSTGSPSRFPAMTDSTGSLPYPSSDNGFRSNNSSSDFDEELLDPALKPSKLSSPIRNKKRSLSDSSMDRELTSNQVFNNGRIFNSEAGNAAVQNPLRQYIALKTKDDLSRYDLLLLYDYMICQTSHFTFPAYQIYSLMLRPSPKRQGRGEPNILMCRSFHIWQTVNQIV